MNRSKMFSALLLALLIICLQVFGCPVSVVAESDPAVPYGVTTSKDGQYIPVFDRIDSGKRIDLLMPDQMCALDFSKLQGKYDFSSGDEIYGTISFSTYRSVK